MFEEKHQNCFKNCCNCHESFKSPAEFNSHLIKCQVDIIDDLKKRLIEHESEISEVTTKLQFMKSLEHSRKSTLRRNRGNVKKEKNYCNACGENFSQMNRNHDCKLGLTCRLCFSKVPFNIFVEHVIVCKTEGDEILSRLHVQLQNSKEVNQPETRESAYAGASPSSEINPLNVSGSDLSDQNSQKISSNSADSSAPSSQSDYNSKQHSIKSKLYRKKKNSDQIRIGLNKYLQSIEEEKQNLVSPMKTRRGHKQYIEESPHDSETIEEASCVLAEELTRAGYPMVSLEPSIRFFSSCCSHNEKKFVIATLLPDKIEDHTLALFAKAFSVKRDYIEECYQERQAKLQGGLKYQIKSNRKCHGQINIEDQVKKTIVETIESDSQLWPSVNMKAQIPCSSVKDRVLTAFYETQCEQSEKRGTKQYKADRKVLPISFESHWRLNIKTKFPQVSFYQYLLLVPFWIHACHLGWSNSCRCHYCSNFAFSLDLLQKIAEMYMIEDMLDLSFESLLEHDVCSRDYQSIVQCFRKRRSNYCFNHVKRMENCASCTHSCESRISQFIYSMIGDIAIEGMVPFPRLKQIQKDKYIPLRARDTDSRMNVKEAIDEAIRLIKISMEHVNDVKQYRAHKPKWSIPKNITLHQNVTRVEADFGTPLTIRSPFMAQNEFLSSENNFVNLRTGSFYV